MSPIGWEVGALFTLFALALWFLPTYLKMGTTTIPQLMEARFGRGTKLMFSFIIVVMYSILNLPVILYSGAVVFENIFDISGIFGISKFTAVAILCVVIGIIGGCYAIFGGLKAVAVSDTINGIGLIIGGLMILFLALALLGHETTGGGLVEGSSTLYKPNPKSSTHGLRGMLLNRLCRGRSSSRVCSSTTCTGGARISPLYSAHSPQRA